MWYGLLRAGYKYGGLKFDLEWGRQCALFQGRCVGSCQLVLVSAPPRVLLDPFEQGLPGSHRVVQLPPGKHVLHHLPQAVSLREVVVNQVDLRVEVRLDL